jgi:heterodisulfide reductase subunit B
MDVSNRLAQRVMEAMGENVYLCYQCVKCTSGCPLVEFFDWQPNQIMRAVQLGQEDIAYQSVTPWLCAACQTCTTRCPQGLDIAGIMEFLTREARQHGYQPGIPEVENFNEAFLRQVRWWGRAYEAGMMAEMKLRRPDGLLDDVDLYMRMLRKHKVAFLPKPTRPAHPAKKIPGAAEAVAYYPGCSLHSTAKEYNSSAEIVCHELGIDLVEPPNWICCGSSAAHRADPQAAIRLPMENLAMIEQSGFSEVTMPCAACFNRHQAALYEIRHDSDARQQVEQEIGYAYQDRVQVTPLYQAILARRNVEVIAGRVKQPLKGLRLVCYYGCLLTRPPEVTGAEHPENPCELDELMRALGAEVLDWSYKTTCCGAAHSLTRPDIVLKLSGTLIQQAREAGADLVVVACPLCHANLDARQFQMNLDESMPVLYFTQLMALAFGLPEKAAALEKNMVDPLPLFRSKNLFAA